ncbi:hypothetical protein [Methylomarinum vadi]|uniref:hypothetical protein n=1 Tax=Methylomarinum vadi TaxID=438855 RepID=UPI00068CBF5B|nr:hypothetical protein [Methylomarinum vadi]
MSADKQAILERLNPADSFTLAMDDEIRRDGLAGSYGCFALELSKTPNIEELKRRIEEFAERFPVAQASLRQIGRRFYWCRREEAPPLFFHHRCPEDQEEAGFQRATIDLIVNEKLARESTPPIEFHLLTGPRQNTLFTRWLHPFCDARGADLILKFLCTADAEQRSAFGQPLGEPLVYAQLAKYRWWQKIALLWKGKRYIDNLDRLESIQPFDCDRPRQRLNYSLHRLSEAQTEQVLKLARESVGLTGTSLYYIGCLMRALERLHPDRDGEAYCVPYAFNLRKQRALAPVTGNHVCALFAQAPRDIVKDRSRIFEHLKRQNAEVIRKQQDYAFLPLMWAGSWLSLPEYGKTLRLSYGSGKERSSFWFSDIGRLDIAPGSFPGAEISNVFHVCQMTTPPGLAFLSCIFQGRLTLSYNFVEPIADSALIERLHQLMLEELLGQTS